MPKDTLHLVLVQDNPTVGDVAGNTSLVLRGIKDYPTADLIVFSECFVSGYPLGDLVMRPGFIAEVDKAIDMIRSSVMAASGPAVLVGAPMAGSHLPYNAAYLIEPNGTVRTVRKRALPNNDVFDEVRTFDRADGPATPLSFRGFQLGVQICEDMWHGAVSRDLADELADVLLVLNGSPYQRGKQSLRMANARARVRATGLPLIYVNQVGGQDELVFDGGTFTLNSDGGAMTGATFAPAVLKVALCRAADSSVRIEYNELPQVRALQSDIEADYNACVIGVRDYVRKTGTPRVFVGVSGGLDSALVLAMAVDALGPDRVVGVMMPSELTGDESLSLADDLMSRLGVHQKNIPIGETLTSLQRQAFPVIDDLAESLGIASNIGLTNENAQSRIRGMTLMALTNALGGIVLSTGNKSEMAVGYATLYGDMCGGFNPLKSVYKSDAFKMAAWRNKQETLICADHVVLDPIPARIISRPPTAELAEGQTDQASLGDYDVFDFVLRLIIEEKATAEAAARAILEAFDTDGLTQKMAGLTPKAYAEKIARLIRIAQFKRDQSPPGVKLNPTDFGLGWRYPKAGLYSL
jgi:NAD+ synthase